MTSTESPYPQTTRTTPSRHAERAHYDEETIHGILDEAFLGHVAYVIDGEAFLQPMLFVRSGRTVFLHSSTGAHAARVIARRGSVPGVFETTIVDGLVLARSAFAHSVNYRSVVAHGGLRLVTDADEKDAAMTALVDKLVPGRSTDARMPAEDEMRQTAVIALELDEVGAKVRRGGPIEYERDAEQKTWSGVVPVERRWGSPEAAEASLVADVPAYLAALAGTSTSA